jgi:hypothetical protein
MTGVAERSELQHEDAVLRFGLHWGATATSGGSPRLGAAR